MKTYIVFQWLNAAPVGAANIRVYATKLTMDAAQAIVDRIPGTFVEKHVADKD